MVKRRVVTLTVDEDFFKTFERERQKEQSKLRKGLGGMFNLSQRNFTAMLAAKGFKFDFPRQQSLTRVRKRRRR